MYTVKHEEHEEPQLEDKLSFNSKYSQDNG